MSVVVVGICSAWHLARCLDALDAQVGAPPFEVVVAFDPRLAGIAEVAARHPRVRFVSTSGRESPIELMADGLNAAAGDVLLATEDHCVPAPHWVRELVDAISAAPDAGAVGGSIGVADDATSTDWALFFVDFFRYMPPFRSGAAPTLSHCNVAYRRSQLARVADVWANGFHETAVHDAVRARLGPLRAAADATVIMRRHVRLRDGTYERYAFGRLFGCVRLEHCSPARRAYYIAFAPLLPALLLGRLGAKGLTTSGLRWRFMRALPVLVLFVLAWSWGEWLGYVTGRRPRVLTVAPELRTPA